MDWRKRMSSKRMSSKRMSSKRMSTSKSNRKTSKKVGAGKRKRSSGTRSSGTRKGMRQTRMSEFFEPKFGDFYCPPDSEIANLNLYKPTGCASGETPFYENGTFCCDEPLHVGRTQEEFWDRQNKLYYNPDLEAAEAKRAKMFKRQSFPPPRTQVVKTRRLSDVPQVPLLSPESFVDKLQVKKMKWYSQSPP